MQKWVLNPDAFDQLLSWLDSDREQAGVKYEQIRSKLIRIYRRRGCSAPEDLADEIIDRVASKIPQVMPNFKGDPALYFFKVAQYVYKEYLNRNRVQDSEILNLTTQQLSPKGQEDKERLHQCLDHCLESLDSQNREIILTYFRDDSGAKIDDRKSLADKFSLVLPALRMRIHRIKNGLEDCLTECTREAER